jgi:hypothetical protein
MSCKNAGTDRNHQRRAIYQESALCRTCFIARRRERKRGARLAHVARTYGLDADQYAGLLQLQQGRCAGCRRRVGVVKAGAVDHDHATGRVRGILCSTCNRFLGHIQDQPETLFRLGLYLISPPFDQFTT